MEYIQTTYTVIIKKKIEKEVWKVEKWQLRDLENNIKMGYIKNKTEAFKYIVVGEYINEEIELEKQVYANLPFIPGDGKVFYVKYKSVEYPVSKMYLDTDKKTFVVEVFVESETIEKINYDELEKAFEEEYEAKWKKLIEETANKTKKETGIFFKGYKKHNFFRTK